jgi:hypothetical protein
VVGPFGTGQSQKCGEVQGMRLIEGDGVHLTARTNRNAAVSLCRRVREMLCPDGREDEMAGTGDRKRRRVE